MPNLIVTKTSTIEISLIVDETKNFTFLEFVLI